MCACMGWTHCCTVRCRNRKKKDTEVCQLESAILPREDREKTTLENGAVLNGHRPEPLERAGGNTDGMEMVEAELHATPENEGGRTVEQNRKGASGAVEREIEEQPSRALAGVNSQRPSNSGGPALLHEGHPGTGPVPEVKDTGEMADGGATVSETTVAADVHRDSTVGQIDHSDTCSPQQTKVSGSKSKAFKPAPLSILPPGETYTSGTLPSETMHAAGKTAVSPKSATLPERTSPKNTEPQSVRRVKTKPVPPKDHRFSDRIKTKPAAKDQLAHRPRSAAPEVKRTSKDYQETTPGDQSPLVQGGYYNSLKNRQSLTLEGKETDD
ncbi:hypothetical protein GBAR_LOCUS27824 [Geodia barretti]|nr:hypothetical protein GBAR_LOCUS27824 [Geodia barretti]